MDDSGGPKHFNDFTRISIKNKRLSSATVSKRLDELTEIKAIEEVVSKSKTGRRIISYRATDKGKRILGLAGELNKAIGTPKGR